MMLIGTTPPSAWSSYRSASFISEKAGPGGPARTRGSAPHSDAQSPVSGKVCGIGQECLRHESGRLLLRRPLAAFLRARLLLWRRLLLRTSGLRRLGRLAWRHVEAEDRGEVLASQELAGGRPLLRQGSRRTGAGDQFRFVHRAPAEEEFGLAIEPRADAVERCRHMLAHAGPVRATALELDLGGRREKTPALAGDSPPDPPG